MVKAKYVNRVYKKFKYIANNLAMWDNKKFMYVSVDYVIYEMCDIPKNISREDILKEAIPHCHYQISDNDKEAIELYFNKMNELSLSAQYGNKLPDENFYYSI